MSPAPLRFTLLLAVTLCLFGSLSYSQGSARNPARKSFDIPAGWAEKTLRTFSEQSGIQVGFSSSLTDNVRTNPVKGVLTPIEAADKLLAGTRLKLIADEVTGVYSVVRDPSAGSDSPQVQSVGRGSLFGRVSNAVTGSYLNNASVSVRGSTQMVLTDEYGVYRLVDLPAGGVVLDVYYTGLDRKSTLATVSANSATEFNISLTSVARYGSQEQVVQLNAFEVAASREMDSETLAVNEQRFAPNIKNVIATDSIGDPIDGSLGDLLRFLPGVSGDYTEGLETEGVMIRGFPSEHSQISIDGSQAAGASAGGGRQFDPSRIGADGFSRVEVTKVPLPSSPADTMAGSINLVSKSAFERSKAIFNYRVGFSSSLEKFSLEKTPAPSNERTLKLYPDVGFDYSLPVNKRLGIVLTGRHVTTAYQTNQAFTEQRGVNVTNSAVPVTPANPFLELVRENDRYRENTTDSMSLRVDWKSSDSGVLSFIGTVNQYNRFDYQSNSRIETGTNGAPTIANGVHFTFSPEFVEGATGRGNVAQNFNNFDSDGLTQSAGLRYRFDDGVWRIRSSVNFSRAKATRTDVDAGYFSNVTARLAAWPNVRVAYTDIKDGHPGDYKVYDNANQEIDVGDANSWIITRAADAPDTLIRKTINSGDLDVRREIRGLPFPLGVQVGGMYRTTGNDDRRFDGRTYDYTGINGSVSAAPYLNDIYNGESKLIAFSAKPFMPWISTHKVLDAFKQNPALFIQTVAQKRTTEVNNIVNSKYITETVSAGYVQLEARFLKNRLSLVTGVRHERTELEAEGPLQDPDAPFARNADGTFARTSTGARIRKPEAGAAGSVEEVALIYKERAATASRTYDGLYPSFHLNFNLTRNIVLRAAYARTYGRPNYNNIIPDTIINQDDNDQDVDEVLGSITLTNPALRPWTADNYDFSAEYYTNSGGLISAGVFLKEVDNFFGRYAQVATQEDLEMLGLDDSFLGWRITTQFNVGDARIVGGEVNVRQSLQPFGAWGRHVTVFANATKLNLEGDTLADFRNFLPKSANWGFTVSHKRVTLGAKWSYRGEQKLTAYTKAGADGSRYAEPRLQTDFNISYRLTKRISAYFNMRNLNSPVQKQTAHGSATPAHAYPYYYGTFGRVFTAGVRGSF